MFQLVARFVTNQSVYIALCSRNHSLMVVTFSTRTVTLKSKIGKYRKSFLTSFKDQIFVTPKVEFILVLTDRNIKRVVASSWWGKLLLFSSCIHAINAIFNKYSR